MTWWSLAGNAYSRPDQLNYWSSEELLGSGLNPLESALLDRIPIKSGKALVLFSGGGRDVFPWLSKVMP